MQWVIIDSRVYDLSRFKALHPGGISVLLDEEIGMPVLTPFIEIRLIDEM